MEQLQEWAEEHVRKNLYQYTAAGDRKYMLMSDEVWAYCEEHGGTGRYDEWQNAAYDMLIATYERLIRDPANWTNEILNHWIREVRVAEDMYFYEKILYMKYH